MLFDDDLVRMYANKRKDIHEDEVEDLLKAMVEYIKVRTKSGDCYAINIPRVGILYREMISKDPLFYLEENLNVHSIINKTDLIKKDYGNRTKEEIQEISNNSSLKI